MALSAQKQEMVKDILKEKMRLPYSKLVEMYEAKQKGEFPLPQSAIDSRANKTSNISESKLSGSTNSDIDEGETFIAINPNDSNHLVASYMALDNSGTGVALTFPIYYSMDGGLSWTKSSFLTETVFNTDFPNELIGGGGDPVFAFDNAGKLYFSWIYLGIDIPGDRASFVMNWAYSNDGGATFLVEPDSAHFIGSGELIDLQTTGGNISNTNGDGIFDRQWMDVDRSGGPNDGRLYVSTLFVPSDSTDLSGAGTVVRIKEANNANFNVDNIPVSTDIQTQFGNVAVDNSGTAHVTYTSISDSTVRYSNMLGTNNNFNPPTTLTNVRTLFPQTAPYHSRSNGALNLVADPINDNLYACYSDFGTGRGVRSYLIKSTDGGNTWSNPEDISTFTDNQIVLMPVVAAYGNTLSLSYYNIDSVASINNKGIYKTIQSVDGGSTWLNPRALSSDTTLFNTTIANRWFGDYNNSVRTNCHTYSIWGDGRSGNNTKVYVAITDNCQELSITELSPLSSVSKVGAIYPNPVKSTFFLPIETADATEVQIKLYNLSGALVAHFGMEELKAGKNELALELKPDLTAGTYLLYIEVGKEHFTRKLLVE
jgi:hypothetical protein